MADWAFVQTHPSQELAQLHFFSMKKVEADGVVEFFITVKEYAERNQQFMKFYAESDKQVNQKTAPFTPFGWGETLASALADCMTEINRYPYEGEFIKVE